MDNFTSILADWIEGMKTLADQSVHCIVTSPPYYALRDYGLAPSEWPAIQFKSLFGHVVKVPAMTYCLGMEPTIEAFIAHLVYGFREARRVLHDDGTLWVNMGDSYCSTAGGTMSAPLHIKGLKAETANARVIMRPKHIKAIKPKDLLMIPALLAIALREDGWYLRSDIIWHKPNPMPESVTDRPTKAHEYIFMLSKSPRYYYDAAAIREALAESTLNDKRLADPEYEAPRVENGFPGNPTRGNGLLKRRTDKQRGHSRRHDGFNDRWDGMTKEQQQSMGANKRDVWTIATQPYAEAHFATFPEKLIEPCILAGTSAHGHCSCCGKGWVRITETTLVPTHKASYNTQADERDAGADNLDQGSNRVKDGHKPGWINEVTTLGWKPQCKCNAPIMPATVLDPFGGSGTTAVVAISHRRHAIIIEKKPAYKALSDKRVNGTQIKLFTAA